MSEAAILLWFRRDLRLADHPMVAAALAMGRPVVPVFILDPETEAQGAAARWRLALSVQDFARSLQGLGGRLIVRRGPAAQVLRGLVAETGAADVMWSHLYDPVSKARDQAVTSALMADGIAAAGFAGHLLHEPWQIATGQGGFYKVFTPYWRAVRARDVGVSLPRPQAMTWPADWPASDDAALDTMGLDMQRGAAVVLPYQQVGEAAAARRLGRFLAGPVADYAQRRDFLAEDATSGLSENLAYGEIGPRHIWHAGYRAMLDGLAGAETFLKELVWREFAYHLVFHTPHLTTGNWRPEWDEFAWRADNPDAERWRRGMTGEPVVDAAMRQMYVTGTMHNRARMIVASYLTKHLLTNWRVGQAWFAQCLTDWDPAANAMGWQWVAGSGPDAAPYFRIFNPATQAEKFDGDGVYRRRWLDMISPKARSFFAAVPVQWDLRPDAAYPEPVISLAEGRMRALSALSARKA